MVAVALALAWAGSACADVFVASDGVVYAEAPNGHGTVLRGRGETIHPGRDCDAMVRGLGYGRWSWDISGTLVSVGRYVVHFPRQSPDFSPGRCMS